MDSNVKLLLQRWLIEEPALYRIICTHDICENKQMKCNIRCGKGKIEYNPNCLSSMTYSKVNELFKSEAIRIVLGHPYDRQPDCCNKKSTLIGSNLVLGDNYVFNEIAMPNPQDYGLENGLSFEQYSFRIQDLLNEISSSSPKSSSHENDSSEDSSISSEQINNEEGNEENPETTSSNILFSNNENTANNSSDSLNEEEDQPKASSTSLNSSSQNNSNKGSKSTTLDNSTSTKDKLIDVEPISLLQEDDIEESALWEEDPFMQCAIENAIEEIKNSGCSWGSVSANHVEQILASTKAKIDYRKVLAGFRSTILSSKRNLTRMRPNRRSGFDNMGSIRRYNTKLLIGVDVSGSVKSESLRHFFSVISRLFKYGIEKVDVIQFDCAIKDITSFEKAQKNIKIAGRGGTNFQPIIDYAADNSYDGLIIFTDGYAETPNIKKLRGCRLAWVCDSEKNYKENATWMKKQGRCCFVEV